MMHSLFLFLALCLSPVTAFVITPYAAKQSTTSFRMTTDDLFDNYEIRSTQTVATKDLVVGNGETIQDGDIAKLSYKGTIMATGSPFDEGVITFKKGTRY